MTMFRVVMVENLGEAAYTYIDYGAAQSLIVKAEGELPVTTDQQKATYFNAANCHLFDSKGVSVPKLLSV